MAEYLKDRKKVPEEFVLEVHSDLGTLRDSVQKAMTLFGKETRIEDHTPHETAELKVMGQRWETEEEFQIRSESEEENRRQEIIDSAVSRLHADTARKLKKIKEQSDRAKRTLFENQEKRLRAIRGEN